MQHEGQPHCKIIEKSRAVYYPLTANEKAHLKPGPKWASDVQMANGSRKRVSFSTVKAVAEKQLAQLLEEIEMEKHGIRPVAQYLARPLAELLNEYRQYQADKGNTPEQVLQACRHCEMTFEACSFLFLADLDSSAVERWLADRRAKP